LIPHVYFNRSTAGPLRKGSIRQMSIFMFLIIGLCSGWVATRISGTRSGTLQNLIIGMVGAAIGGILFSAAGVVSNGFVGSLISATLGSLVLIFVIGRINR
jgi:uncharacterized membrane protein YeaQ/YmgE (transglycosylase-associated protein family)